MRKYESKKKEMYRSSDHEINGKSEPVINALMEGLKPCCAETTHSRNDMRENSWHYQTRIHRL